MHALLLTLLLAQAPLAPVATPHTFLPVRGQETRAQPVRGQETRARPVRGLESRAQPVRETRAQPAADTVVVAPQSFLPALEPWIQYRTEQGHRIQHVSNLLSADQIRQSIREVAKAGSLRYVLLVGDADPAADSDPEVRSRSTPTHLAEAKVNVRWGSEPHLATDNWYADLDDDQLPNVAIGRLPADTPAELARMVERILAYERSFDFGSWRQRINFVAGVGGFGPLVDPLLEMATTRFLTEGIPAAYDTTMTYGSWRSAYCPDPRKFHDHTIDRLNEGCLFWVYIGHGQRTLLDRVQTPIGQHHILATSDMNKLRSNGSPPIAIFLACYTGAFDDAQDCLAEEMLRSEGGPVAVFSGSRVTMPYAMAVMGTLMMDEYFQQRRVTLGDVILHAKRRMADDATRPSAAEDAKAPAHRQLLDSLAAALSPDPDLLSAERLEHVQLFNLLGDPLMRVHHPASVRVATVSSIEAGERLKVAMRLPLAGKATVELVCRRDRSRMAPPNRPVFQPSTAWLASFDPVYQQANDRRWAGLEMDLDEGDFEIDLDIPIGARGPCHVRVHLAGETSFAVGAAELFIKRPKPVGQAAE